jgi:hypothetical protein
MKAHVRDMKVTGKGHVSDKKVTCKGQGTCILYVREL